MRKEDFVFVIHPSKEYRVANNEDRTLKWHTKMTKMAARRTEPREKAGEKNQYRRYRR